jgi:hypothetical protein
MREELSLENSTLKLAIPPHDFRLIEVRNSSFLAYPAPERDLGQIWQRVSGRSVPAPLSETNTGWGNRERRDKFRRTRN